MTERPYTDADLHAEAARPPGASVRPVIEHALIDYGYSLDTAGKLLDLLTAEEAAQ